MEAPFPVLNFILLIAALILLVGALILLSTRSSKRSEVALWRGRSEAAERETEKVRERANRLHDDLDSQLHAVRELTDKITHYEERPDLTKLLHQLDANDQRAAERHLQLIAAVDRLLNQ